MGIRKEVTPFLLIAAVVSGLLTFAAKLLGMPLDRAIVIFSALFALVGGYFLYFFRDPDRHPPEGSDQVIAAADGVIALIKEVREDEYLKADCVRISIFLSLFDVHVNRAPIAGSSKFLGYFPGKHFFTFKEKSSDYNQHNSIMIKGEKTSCLINQIVGPVCRRVVYFLDHDNEVTLKTGDKIGMMKFGSRLDMYFPVSDVEVTAKVGDRVSAGETVIAKIIPEVS